ncbi:disintegrin and metalloproteinase domain-containing protein adm-2-like [Anopheles bellator]|uniref:disintegrin and metalloproteinase domain-containing protein adm-2-like n=1 Tax=Anopheles bellator TaxID=139047 RepID=UPI002647C306|nr:disintegrin and metalloproteinase domain-containing protein adm-2-like [Anopheles bellator]
MYSTDNVPHTGSTQRATHEAHESNPIYPILVPASKEGTATLTYNLNGKVTVLQLTRKPGGSQEESTGGCQHYRHDQTGLIVCDGHIRGTFHRKDGIFRLEYDASAGLHFIHRLKEADWPRKATSRRVKRNQLSTIKGPYQANRHSRYVELLLVVDRTLYQKLGSDAWKVYDYCTNIANHINMLYNPLNIFIALTDVIMWMDKDAITVSPKAEETLNSFLLYRSRTLLHEYPHDHAQLLTAIEFRDNVIGKAKVAGMCSDQSSGAIVRVHTEDVAVQANTVAHEMGHSFTMEHDEDGNCSCPDRKCIMTSTVTGLRLKHWSNCSTVQLAGAFRRGLHHCLTNRPMRLAMESCGNGFVEPGEECDCGLEEACENPCCDAPTCRLRPGAECATGECCDLATCQVREAATVCRSAGGECDLPEYCTGESEYCPPDVHRRDTEVCAGGAAHCIAGHCRTRTDQCRTLWGPSGHAASDACYKENTKGTKYANCGYEGRPAERFRKCDAADVQCGLLFCHHHRQGEELDMGLFNGETWHSVAKGNETFRRLYCHSAYVDLGDGHAQHPAFVPDGAPCGQDRMCYRQRCESIERLNAWGLGAAICPRDCHGRGVCNSEGHCHCQPGYDPPFCEHRGVGGSLDSGPPSTVSPVRQYLTLGSLVILGCIVTIVLLILCLRSPFVGPVGQHRLAHWRRPWRLYKVRGTSPRTTTHKAPSHRPCIARDTISLPKYHSSTRDISDDRQFRPIMAVTVVNRPEGSSHDPQLTLQYPLVVPVHGRCSTDWRPPAPINRQRPF